MFARLEGKDTKNDEEGLSYSPGYCAPLSLPKLQKITSDKSHYQDDRVPQCPHSQVTPLSCAPACDTAWCPKPGFRLLPSAPHSSQTPPVLSPKHSPGFLHPLLRHCCETATGSEGHRAAHTTAMVPSPYEGTGVTAGEMSRNIYRVVARGSTAAGQGYWSRSLSWDLPLPVGRPGASGVVRPSARVPLSPAAAGPTGCSLPRTPPPGP